ncbi:TPA: antitermination protein, partial [Salmonella enterica]|nr:antitermination protein [Salmonella enterica]
MKLESSLKHFNPQGMYISDSVKGTSPDRITGTDVIVAIG